MPRLGAIQHDSDARDEFRHKLRAIPQLLAIDASPSGSPRRRPARFRSTKIRDSGSQRRTVRAGRAPLSGLLSPRQFEPPLPLQSSRPNSKSQNPVNTYGLNTSILMLLSENSFQSSASRRPARLAEHHQLRQEPQARCNCSAGPRRPPRSRSLRPRRSRSTGRRTARRRCAALSPSSHSSPGDHRLQGALLEDLQHGQLIDRRFACRSIPSAHADVPEIVCGASDRRCEKPPATRNPLRSHRTARGSGRAPFSRSARPQSRSDVLVHTLHVALRRTRERPQARGSEGLQSLE